MGVKLLTATVWRQLTELARRRNRLPAAVAVPYLGGGATKRLPLRRGDILVTRFDDSAFAGGLVDPKEVVKYLRRGVEVHAVANLHAKVFVLGDTAVVGSTNVSTQSADQLIEAACESGEVRFVASAARFVRSMLGDVVGLEFARGKIPLYRPPRHPGRGVRGRKGPRPQQSAMVAVMLSLIDYDESDTDAEQRGTEDARRRLQDPAHFAVEDFRWTSSVPPALKPGARVLRCTHIGKRKTVVEAPARVLSVRRYRSPSGTRRAMVFVEARKWARKKALSTISRRVPAASMLGRVGSCRLIRDPDLSFKLGQVWYRSS